MKKQYDAHVQFWSEKKNQCYHCILFVGHCTAEDLVSHFIEFGIRIKWDPKYLLHIGMDGPNVNLSFEKKLLVDFERKYSTKFLKLGSCSLHHVHNTYRKALQKLDIDIDQFAYDVHFFKLSSARREDYAALEELTNITAWYALQHVSSRWLTLKPVILRLLE